LEQLEKEGYLWNTPVFLSFSYDVHKPKGTPDYMDPAKRVVFHMWRKGMTEPMIQCGKRVPVEEVDSEYAVNLLSSQRGAESTPAPDLRIKLHYISPDEPGHQYDREMVLEAATGSLAETEDTYLFLAAENGYQKELKYYVKPTDLTGEHWKRKFYLRSRNGRMYAGLEVQFTLFPHVIDIKALINPNGSRILEPDPSKQITDPEEIRRLDEQTR